MSRDHSGRILDFIGLTAFILLPCSCGIVKKK